MSPLLRLAAIVGYLAALLLVDTRAGLPGQLALGVLTWLVLGWLLLRETPLVRAQTLVVVCVATCGEIVGSIIWGVYTYRLENLPSFVPRRGRRARAPGRRWRPALATDCCKGGSSRSRSSPWSAGGSRA